MRFLSYHERVSTSPLLSSKPILFKLVSCIANASNVCQCYFCTIKSKNKLVFKKYSVWGVQGSARRGCSGRWRRHRAVIDLLLISTRTTPPTDKQGAKACARAVLPHSIPLGAVRLVRSPPYSLSFRFVQLLTRRRRATTTRTRPSRAMNQQANNT